jgi:dihydrodipicolinate synthase/N-acetylneuraminate lyase
MKAMMDVQGQVGGAVRPPLVNLRDDELKEIRAMMEQWKPVL